MKRITFAALFVVAATVAFAGSAKSFGEMARTSGSDEGIRFFDGTWQDCLALAKAEKKLIFLDAYAAWCGPCKVMSATTFKEQKVGEFFNKNFVNYKMDMEKNADGPRLSEKYGLNAYPTLYFVDKNEKLVHYVVGAVKSKDLIAVAEVALKK